LKFETRALATILLLLFTALPAFAERGPFVKGMTYRYQDRDLLVSLGVGAAFDRPDLKEAIMSTRPVSITFTVELQKQRTMWTFKTVARRKLVHTVRYDNLTRQFALETTLDGKMADQRVVETWDEMVLYLSEVADLKVTSVANMDPANTYTVRAQIHLLNDFTLWIIPWDVQTPWVSQTLSTP
jgi:hypothetical protein